MENCSIKPKKRLNSKKKGNQAELDFANWLKENLNIFARRGAHQGGGGAARPDVECDLPLHFEVKCVEKLSIYDAIDQALRDTRFDNIPVVAHRRNRTPWHITILARDLEEFARIIHTRKKSNDL